MLIYYILFFFVLVLGLVLSKVKHGKGIFLCISGLVLYIISSIRKSVGYDYNLYATFYHDAAYKPLEIIGAEKLENGFMLPVKVLQNISTDYQLLFIAISLVIIVAIMAFIYKKSPLPVISVASFLAFGVFFNSMNFMRQIISAIILMYALIYVEKKCFFKFVALVLLASTVHISSLIYIPFYLLFKIKMNTSMVVVLSSFGAVGYLLSNEILQFVTRFVYTDYDISTNSELTMGLPIGYAIVFSVIFLIVFAFRKRLIEKNEFNSVLINCLYFVALFEFFGTKHAVLARFSITFLLPSVLILLPYLVIVVREYVEEKIKDKSRSRLVVACLSIVMGLAGLGIYTDLILNDTNGVVPYRTIFDEEIESLDGTE